MLSISLVNTPVRDWQWEEWCIILRRLVKWGILVPCCFCCQRRSWEQWSSLLFSKALCFFTFLWMCLYFSPVSLCMAMISNLLSKGKDLWRNPSQVMWLEFGTRHPQSFGPRHPQSFWLPLLSGCLRPILKLYSSKDTSLNKLASIQVMTLIATRHSWEFNFLNLYSVLLLP